MRTSNLPARRGPDTTNGEADCRARELNPRPRLQLRHPRDVDGNAPRLVRRPHSGRRSFSLDTSRPDDLAPLLGFVGDELAAAMDLELLVKIEGEARRAVRALNLKTAAKRGPTFAEVVARIAARRRWAARNLTPVALVPTLKPSKPGFEGFEGADS